MKRSLAFIIFVVLLIVSGTVYAQDALVSPEELRREFTERFGAEVSLSELVDYALENTPEVRLADARVSVAESRVEAADRYFSYNPEVKAEVGIGTGEGPLDGVEVSLTQRLEIFGQAGLRREVADHHVERFGADLDVTRRQTEADLRRAYSQALLLEERIEIAEERVSFDDQLLDIASSRVELGEEPQISVILAEAEAADARQGLIEAWSIYAQTLRLLAESIGWREEEPPRPGGVLPMPFDELTVEVLTERAVDHDPTLAALRAARAESQTEAELFEREARPDPLVGLRYEFEEPFATTPGHSLFFIVGLPLPVFDRNQGPRSAATARTELAQRAIEDREQLLESRIIRHVEAIEDVERQLSILDEEVIPALQSQLDLLQEGFELGELSLLDAVTARQRLLDARHRQLGTTQRLVDLQNDLVQLLPMEMVE